VSDRVLRFVLKPAVFAAALVPAGQLAWGAYTGDLTADPLAELTNQTGIWTLRLLCLTLAITPLRRITGWNQTIRFRRMIGLFAFFYGTLHLLVFILFDRLASLGVEIPGGLAAWSTLKALALSLGPEIAKRPYITVGFTAWVCLLLLAATSTAGWIRRLGGKRWNLLHRIVYLAGVLAVLHYWWLVKADVSRPAAYGVVVALLLGYRLYRSRMRRAPVARGPVRDVGHVRPPAMAGRPARPTPPA
jgi:sulfoxide reductase heme-binding subunit YedZ